MLTIRCVFTFHSKLMMTTAHRLRQTLQLARQSWLIYAAGPSHNWAQFFRQLYITEKSFLPGCSSCVSSSSVNSAIHPTKCVIFSFLLLNKVHKKPSQLFAIINLFSQEFINMQKIVNVKQFLTIF